MTIQKVWQMNMPAMLVCMAGPAMKKKAFQKILKHWVVLTGTSSVLLRQKLARCIIDMAHL